VLSRGTRSGWRSSARDVVALVVYAGMLSTVISATVGVTSLWAARLLPDSQIASAWRIWWVGDLGGDIAVAPALLIFASGPTLMRRPWIRSEAIALGVALAAATAVAFTSRVSVAYVVIPMLLWIAVRFGQPGTTWGA
jgi:integral membrane sensor domain MASE1